VNLSLSPQLRLIAVLGLTAVALLMGALFFMTRAQLAAEDEAAEAPVVSRPAPTANAPTSATKPKATAASTPKAQAAKTPAVQRTVAMRLAAAKRLPYTIARELGEHRVVVAVLVVPDASLDATVLAEARAAAESAGVGFVSVNVLRERAGRALAERLGVVETPAVIVYRRPAKAFLKLEGFADRDTVAQAVANARSR
jgi:cytoskeletal protein RodZ